MARLRRTLRLTSSSKLFGLLLVAVSAAMLSGCVYETQVWWSPLAGAPNPDEPGHLHLSADLPIVGSTISEPLTVDFKVQLHNNPSVLAAVRWSDGSSVKQNVGKVFTCETVQCELIVPLTIDPAKFDFSGYRELRFTASSFTRDGLKRMYNTTRWCYFIDNGKPREDYCGGTRPERFGAAGWYDGVEYMNVFTRSGDFDHVWTGTACFRARFEDDTGFASIDPAFHASPPYEGRVVYEGPGANVLRTICVDTTTLSEGMHRMFLKTEAAGDDPEGVGAGVFTLPFVVDNVAGP